MTSKGNGPSVMANDAAPPSPEPQGGNIYQLTHELRALVHDHIELATLETRLAFLTALKMAIAAAITAIVLVSAWLSLLGAAALGLIGLGLVPAVAMLLVAAANVLLAFGGWFYVKQKSRALGWPVTQQAIKPQAAAETREIAT